MKITTQQVTKYIISDVPRLDPITLLLEDLGPRQGQITISCYGKSWTAFFAGCGDEGIAHFVSSTVSADYLTDRLLNNAGESTDEPSLEAAQEIVIKEILKDRRKRLLTSSEAREHYRRVLDCWPETMDGAWNNSSGVLQQFLGEEWWYSIPNRPTRGYLYCKRIVEAVQQAVLIINKRTEVAAC